MWNRCNRRTFQRTWPFCRPRHPECDTVLAMSTICHSTCSHFMGLVFGLQRNAYHNHPCLGLSSSLSIAISIFWPYSGLVSIECGPFALSGVRALNCWESPRRVIYAFECVCSDAPSFFAHWWPYYALGRRGVQCKHVERIFWPRVMVIYVRVSNQMDHPGAFGESLLVMG